MAKMAMKRHIRVNLHKCVEHKNCLNINPQKLKPSSRLLRQPDTMVLPSQLFGSGQKMEEFLSEEMKTAIIGTVSTLHQVSPLTIIQTLTSSTPESPLKNNNLILNDSAASSNSNIPTTESLQILDQELILTDQVLKPFWKVSSKNASDMLWLPPTKTDSPDLALISSHGFSNNLERNLQVWQMKTVPKIKTRLKNLLKTSWRSLQSFPPATMVEENILCTRKVRFYPNCAQKQLFDKCFTAHRLCYNNAIQEINKRYTDRKAEFAEAKTCIFKNCSCSKFEKGYFCEAHKNKQIAWNLNIVQGSIRNASMKTNEDLNINEMWLKDVPFDTRGHGVQDAVSAYKTCVANLKNGHINHFELRYINCHKSSKIFWVNKKAVSPGFKIFTQRLKHQSALRFKASDKQWLSTTFPEGRFNNDFKIQRECGKYYLLINFEKEIVTRQKSCMVAALDPGIRTFQTMYSESGLIGKFGESTTHQIDALYQKIDRLRSVQSKVIGKKCHNIRKRVLGLQKKIRDIVANLHNQTSSYLSKNYEKILLPEFGTSKLVQNSPLAKCVKRKMMTYRFYDFKQKLNHQCNTYNTKLIIVKEDFTTMTCTRCGVLNKTIKGSKVFNCSACDLTIERDIGGSRNVLIKTITEC